MIDPQPEGHMASYIRRRKFLATLGGAAAWPLAAGAQPVGKVPRIGYLSPGSASPGPLAYHDEFQRGLRELGYVEGRNIVRSEERRVGKEWKWRWALEQ